ncbi:MAG: hypothetical protein KW788_00970 [Candidatus Doudnabacteria bacterium]|nr:hypothetical protein [Candidatus Doudnabacteria bacterium]
MGAKKGLLSGNKFNGRHTTVIDAAIPMVIAASKRPEVTKIVLSIIRQIGPGPQNLKFKPIPAGLQMTIRSTNAKQEFYLYTSSPDLTKKELEKAWAKEA